VQDIRQQKARLELRALYERVDRDLRNRPKLYCEMSGRCCRFKEYGHDLFLSELEYKEMRAHGAVPAPDPGVCPWLKDGLCTNREGRALGCRVYFCSDTDLTAEVYEHWHARIRRLHERCGIDYVYLSLFDQMNQDPSISSKGP